MIRPAILSAPSPALDYVFVTRALVSQWRQQAKYPRGRIGAFFGPNTGLHFCSGVDPLDFDFYVLPNFPNGVLLFERGYTAYKAFAEICPDREIIF
jgi:hypothetical protein